MLAKKFILKNHITNKAQNTFNRPFEILKILKNSAILLNPETQQKTKVNFDRMLPYHENI